MRNASLPGAVRVDGRPLPAAQWTYDRTNRTLTVTTTVRPVDRVTTVSYR